MPVVMANKIFFNALKRLNTALRNSRAIQVPLIVSHNHCTVSQKKVEKFPVTDACNPLDLTEAKELSKFRFIY